MFVYSAELTSQFDKPVISWALYIERRESPIPESYSVCLGNDVVNRFNYPVLKIWDYEEEIRSGGLTVSKVETQEEFLDLIKIAVGE